MQTRALENNTDGDDTDRRPLLEITTLGRFEVRYGDVLVSEDTKRSYRMWDLFRYLITFRDKDSLPELIAETLWPDNEYEDPKGAVRTMIYRLRQLLADKTGQAGKTDYIRSHQGGYQWDAAGPYRLDVDDFKRLCLQAEQVAADQPDRAIDLYLRAVSLYKGEYLPECSYHEWAIPVRHRYHRIYLQAVAALIVLLKRARRFSEIMEVCEQAFTVEPLEDELHLAFLEALLATDRLKQARVHYEYVTGALYRELGVKPSAAMRALYRRMQSDQPGMELDLNVIQENLGHRRKPDGAYLCDTDAFRSLYKLEQRRAERGGQAAFLALLTLAGADFGRPRPEILRQAMGKLEDHLVGSLRKGDIISRWGEAQFLVIMPGLNMEQAESVLDRVKAGYRIRFRHPDLILHTKLQSLPPAGASGNN